MEFPAPARHNVRPLETRTERLTRNEVLFREVNERIDDLDRKLSVRTDGAGSLSEYICECADDSCVRRVRLYSREYQEVRGKPTRFFIAPGHEIAEIERMIETNDRFAVVEKRPGLPATLAAQAAGRT